ncbi:MAG: hypothetical protein NTZ80_02060 [Patescibacteria group bacterium]|nr:hypothetical protein [Patescibacteria group bacterium]
MLKTLCIQTVLPKAEVLFYSDSKCRMKSFIANRHQAEKLFSSIKNLIDNDKPEQILIVSGPGAFTGLRVGVTAGNAIAYALNIPIAKITTFDYLRMRADQNLPIVLPNGHDVLWQENANGKIESLTTADCIKKLKKLDKIITIQDYSERFSEEIRDFLSPDKIIPLSIGPKKAFDLILSNSKLNWAKEIKPDYFREAHIG